MTKERPLTDPVDVLNAIRQNQPGKTVNVPGHIVDAVLALCKNARRDADELLSLDVYDLAPLETERTQKDQDTNVDLTGLELDPQSSDKARDDRLFETIYESIRGEVGKQGIKQKSTEEILAEIDKKK